MHVVQISQRTALGITNILFISTIQIQVNHTSKINMLKHIKRWLRQVLTNTIKSQLFTKLLICSAVEKMTDWTPASNTPKHYLLNKAKHTTRHGLVQSSHTR
ncbi:unnamed protein product [Ixodes pacificus]